MRILSADVLVLANRASLPDIDFLSLIGQDIEKLTDDLQACTKLYSLILSRNRIYGGLESLKGCNQLWHIDLSSNRISSLDGFQCFAALGTLNLSKNLIPPKELVKIKELSVIYFSLKGNLPIEKKFGVSYRKNVASLLPHIWVLDSRLVEEGECDLDSYSMNTEDDRWRQGQFNMNDVHHPMITSDLGAKHLKIITYEPPISRGRDKFRLQHLAETYDYEANLFNQKVKKMIFGNRPRLRPQLHLEALRVLSQEVRLELLVGIVSAIYWNVPTNIVIEALTVLLAPFVEPLFANDIVNLPIIGKQCLCYSLRKQLEDEACSVPGAGDMLPREMRLLLDTVPVVVVPPPATTSLSTSSSQTSFQQPDMKDAHSRVTLARQAAIIFSRAPSCPALTASHHTHAHRRTYESLLPLLTAAVSSTNDVDDGQSSSWIKSSSSASPSVNIINSIVADEDELTLDSLALDRDGLIERLGFEGGTSSLRLKNTKKPVEHYLERVDTAEEEEEGGSMSSSQNTAGEPSDLLHARCPKLGERVKMTAEWKRGEVHLVSYISEDRASFTVFPKANGFEMLQRSDVMWDPRGWWIHANAVTKAKKNFVAAKKQTLYRPCSPGSLHPSGVPRNAGVVNVPLPVLARAGKSLTSTNNSIQLDETRQHSAGDNLTSQKNESFTDVGSTGRTIASPVQTFTSHSSWDSEFVLAPPQKVEAQNLAFGYTGSARQWSAIEVTPPIVRGTGHVQMPIDVPYPLQPRESLSGKVMRESLSVAPIVQDNTSPVDAGSRVSTEAGRFKATVEMNYKQLGLTPWESLQREMGTFLQANGHQRDTPLDMDALRRDLELREQLRESNNAGLNERSDGDASTFGGVFDLTTVGFEEKQTDPSTTGSLGGSSGDVDMITEGARQRELMDLMLKEEVADEKTNELRMKKAAIHPWRTMHGKPQVIVEEGMFAMHFPPWSGPQSYLPSMPQEDTEKPPMPLHQLGIIPAIPPNVLAGGRRRARLRPKPTPKGGPVIKGIFPKKLPEVVEEVETPEPTKNAEKPIEVNEPPSRLASLVLKKNEVLWKKSTGKQALRELGFPVR